MVKYTWIVKNPLEIPLTDSRHGRDEGRLVLVSLVVPVVVVTVEVVYSWCHSEKILSRIVCKSYGECGMVYEGIRTHLWDTQYGC